MSMAGGDTPKTDKKSEIKAYIQHHLQDSYDFSLFSYTTEDGSHKYVGAPLPVILWDNGLVVFASSKFHHGETVAEVDGIFYKLYHNKIYKTDIIISNLSKFDEILLVGSGKGVVSISSIKKLNWYRSSMKIYNFLSRKYSKLLIK